jgi:cell shape-determining protein MreC
VDHLAPVQEKELLLSSGDGLVVPRGYGVGVVESYQSDGLYYTGIVKLVHDISHLRTCLVVHRANLLKIS